MNHHTIAEIDARSLEQRAARLDTALRRADRLRQQAWADFWNAAGDALRRVRSLMAARSASAQRPAAPGTAAAAAACRGC